MLDECCSWKQWSSKVNVCVAN